MDEVIRSTTMAEYAALSQSLLL